MALFRAAYTPPITDAHGAPLRGSIASLERVVLGGREQWVLIRGKSVENPVLLFLSGGPCGSEMAWVREDNGALEERFVVVNWDQPGAAKSYSAARPFRALRVADFVRDTVELTNVLRRRFQKERIYLVGHSWGTMLGLRVAHAHPELFAAYVGVSQQLNTAENDLLGYRLTLDAARIAGAEDAVRALEELGEPPYDAGADIRRYVKLVQYETRFGRPPEGFAGPGRGLKAVLEAPEYTVPDRIHFFLGLWNGWRAVYPQLMELDLESEAARMQVPVYAFQGRYDFVVPGEIVARYLAHLDAPHKELVWFERSAHSPPSEEPDRFARELFRVLQQVERGEQQSLPFEQARTHPIRAT